MKPSGITFDSIDCETLEYMRPSNSWVCTELFTDIDFVDFCMRCKFEKLKLKEDEIRKAIRKAEYYA